jgi:hypothetical protein
MLREERQLQQGVRVNSVMFEVEKFKVDYSNTSHFKGIRILFDYLNEGVEYVKQNKILDVCVWSDGNWEKRNADFAFLKEIPFITKFEWIVPLSKSSDISGLYYLTSLKDFRWAVDNDFEIDLSQLNTIESFNTVYSSKITNWLQLVSLRELYLQSISTDDLSFLSSLKTLEKLRVINAKIKSVQGLESCSQLKELRLVKCSKLVNIDSTLNALCNLEKLLVENCKNLIFNKDQYQSKIDYVSVK